MNTSIRGQPDEWPEEVWKLWQEKVAPLFKEGETCSSANYFTPRPYRNEYDRGSKEEGFVYTIYPGPHVCFVEWIPN